MTQNVASKLNHLENSINYLESKTQLVQHQFDSISSKKRKESWLEILVFNAVAGLMIYVMPQPWYIIFIAISFYWGIQERIVAKLFIPIRKGQLQSAIQSYEDKLNKYQCAFDTIVDTYLLPEIHKLGMATAQNVIDKISCADLHKDTITQILESQVRSGQLQRIPLEQSKDILYKSLLPMADDSTIERFTIDMDDLDDLNEDGTFTLKAIVLEKSVVHPATVLDGQAHLGRRGTKNASEILTPNFADDLPSLDEPHRINWLKVVSVLLVVGILSGVSMVAYHRYQNGVAAEAYAKQAEADQEAKVARQAEVVRQAEVEKQAALQTAQQNLVTTINSDTSKSVTLKGGKLEVIAGADGVKLMFDDRQLYNGNLNLSMIEKFVIADREIVLVEDTGGTACPYMYFFVTVLSSRFITVSKSFGTCANFANVEVKDDSVFVLMSGFMGPFELAASQISAADEKHTYVFHNNLVDEDSSLGQYWLGLKYIDGDGIPQDFLKAADIFRKSAARGYAPAQYNLGVMFLNGQGVNQDHSQAIFWFEMAAAQGDANAQNNLGFMYEKGLGVRQDINMAAKWYRKSADQGNEKALENLKTLQ